MLIFKFSPKILEEYVILMQFLQIMKGNDYYNLHKKFEVQNTVSIFELRALNKYRQVATISLYPTFDSLPYCYPKVGW